MSLVTPPSPAEAAAALANWVDLNNEATLCFDSSFEGKVRVEWQSCICIQVKPTDLEAAMAALETLDSLGASTF